jgi:hypothetical protein
MFSIVKAKEKVAILNAELQKKCKNLSLELGFHAEFKNRPSVSIYENMKNPQIILCLNLGTQCVSSIACKITKNTRSMEISSKTHESHEGKKYNTLMRSVILLVASSIEYNVAKSAIKTSKSKSRGKSKTKKATGNTKKTVNKIISRSINPISTLLLVKYFNAHNDDFEEYLEENEIDKRKLTLEEVKEFQQEVETEDMTSSEELAFMENNDSYGEPLLLTVKLTDADTMKTIKDTFDSTLTKVVCS